jgi:hypothetical protein
MALTYAQLVTAITETTENEEDTFYLNIPLFIRQAEQRIYVDAKIPATRKLSNSTCSANNPYMTAPSGFLSPLSVCLMASGVHTFLMNKDVSFMREAFPDSMATGLPQFYALFNETQFILAPTPAANYAIEVQYMGFPTSIVDTGSSWLGNNYETVLLYGALLNAYVFMKGEPDVLAMYEARYKEALAQIKNISEIAYHDEYRHGPRT